MKMQYNDEELIGLIMVQQDRAVDYANTALQQNRATAWNYYLNRPRGDEKPGRSTVQDTSVRDTIHALCATIAPTYDNSHLVDFPPEGPDDEDQADGEARALNAIFRNTENLNEIGAAVKDALLFRNGILKVFIEDKEEVEIRRFREDPAIVQAGMEENGVTADVLATDGDISTVRLTRIVQHLRVKAIEPAYFYQDPNQDRASCRGTTFISERIISTRSELLQLGVKKALAEALPATPDEGVTSGIGMSNTDIIAKFIDGQSDIGDSPTPDQDRIECFWIHMLIDLDGDGISEKWRFLVSNNTLLLKDPVSFFPYATGSAWPVPHRWSGLSVYDLVRITQDECTNARRQLSDNLSVANNQRVIADPGVTDFGDLNAAAPGRGVKSKDPMNVQLFPVADITGNSLSFLQFMKGVRSEQAGASLDLLAPEAQAIKDVSGISAEMQLGPTELMAAEASRNLANTLVKDAFILMHRTLRESWDGPIKFYKAGTWETSEPRQWMARDRINICVSLSPGERRRHAQSLREVLNHQTQLMSAGANNIAVNWSGIHKTLSDLMAAQGLDATEGYFIDPDSPEGKKAQQMASEQAQQQQQVMAQLQQMQAQLEEQKLQLDKYKHDSELKWKYYDTDMDNEVEEAKLVQQAVQSTRESSQGAESPGRRNGSRGPDQD